MAGFPSLPSVQVTLNDLGLAIAPPPSGPKVTLLGVTANADIPLREPLTVTNIGQATAALYAGNSGVADRYPGELSLAVEEAARAGAQNIEVVVIAHQSGAAYENYTSPATGTTDQTTGQVDRLNDLSTAYDAIQNLDLDVVVPVGAWLDARYVDFGSQLAKFCYQATTETDNACLGVIPMMRVGEWAHAYSSHAFTGSDFISEVQTYTGEASYSFNLPSRALLDEWVKYATELNSPVVDVGYKPSWLRHYLDGSEDEAGTFHELDDANLAADVNGSYWTTWQATTLAGGLVVDQRGNRGDAGARISVVGCPMHTSTTQLTSFARGVGAALNQKVQATNGAAAYAGFMQSLPPQSSPTNKRIATLAPQRLLSPTQANRLAGRRIVTFHERASGFVCSNAMTGAYNVSKYVRSDYVRLTTVRDVDSIVDRIRSVSEKYIGEPNTAAQRNALSNEIDKFLKNMRVVNAINGYRFEITATPEQQVLGEATIDLTVVPPFEIIKIQTNISLAKSI
jgi:hypothetical protein